jgi:transcriptional regulator with XRE-family HTH domain
VSQAGSGRFTPEDARDARQRQGMTQFQLAVELGITPQHVSNFERGHSALSPRVLYRLAEILGLPLPDYSEPRESRLDVLERDMADIKLMLADLAASIAELKSALPPRRPAR